MSHVVFVVPYDSSSCEQRPRWIPRLRSSEEIRRDRRRRNDREE